jgi:anti-sigma regulatory factor (Ser/Thr protein kinase)
LVDGIATVTVRDHGGWREPRDGDRDRGIGIPIMQEFMDDVSIERTDQGTTVELERRLREGG